MHGRSRSTKLEPSALADKQPAASPPKASAAVTWIDRSCAIVARTTDDGEIAVATIEERGEGRVPFLVRIAEEVGERERVHVLGSDAMRVEFEREYVSIYRRPDRLVDVANATPRSEGELIGRLLALTGH